MEGWISLHRQIFNHWLYQERRVFSKMEAWIYLLLTANHEDARFALGNEIVHAKKGDVVTSEIKLMERWKWSKEKVRRFLKVLEDDGMIAKKSDRKKTVISIVNYCNYQNNQTAKRPQRDRQQTANRPPADTINNVNNEIKKIDYAFNVHLLETEYERLCEKHGKKIADDAIDYLSSYKASNPKYFRKSDYITITRWVIDALSERKDRNDMKSMVDNRIELQRRFEGVSEYG
jgi:hypothetical protein